MSNYTSFEAAMASLPGTKPNCLWQDVALNCGPRGLAAGAHSLYRSMGNGTFKDVSASAGVDRARSSYGLTVVAADYDDDGWPDIYVACDSSPSLLLLNNHDGTFREQGAMRGAAYNSDGQEQAGMGIAVNDYDLDGRLDILKTDFAGDIPTLYHNEGRGVFDDAVREAGLAVEDRYVAWGAGMCDLDNDGLAIVTGHVYRKSRPVFPNFPCALRGCSFTTLAMAALSRSWPAPPETPLMIHTAAVVAPLEILTMMATSTFSSSI